MFIFLHLDLVVRSCLFTVLDKEAQGRALGPRAMTLPLLPLAPSQKACPLPNLVVYTLSDSVLPVFREDGIHVYLLFPCSFYLVSSEYVVFPF